MAKVVVGMSWVAHHNYDKAAEIASFTCTSLVVYLGVPRHLTVDRAIRAAIYKALLVYYDDRGLRRITPTDGVILRFDSSNKMAVSCGAGHDCGVYCAREEGHKGMHSCSKCGSNF